MTITSCAICGVEFTHLKSKSRKFCSRSCANRSRSTKQTSNCLKCGTEFIHYTGEDQKYCSKQCFYAMPRAKTKTSACQFCHKEFEHSAHKKQQFCSRRCFFDSKKKTVIRECAICGKEFERQATRNAKSKSGLYYCSHQCSGKRLLGKRRLDFKGWYMTRGYKYIFTPDHPRCDKRGYVVEHRLVMETKISRYLKKTENVHHINGIKNDNRPENLTIVQTGPHYGKVECPHCGKHFLIR